MLPFSSSLTKYSNKMNHVNKFVCTRISDVLLFNTRQKTYRCDIPLRLTHWPSHQILICIKKGPSGASLSIFMEQSQKGNFVSYTDVLV